MKQTLDRIELLATFGGRVTWLRDDQLGLRATLPLTRVKATEANGRKLHHFRASDATLDRYNEVIDPLGWDLADFKKNNVILDSHRYSSFASILGTAETSEATK